MGILDKKVVLITGAGGCIFGAPLSVHNRRSQRTKNTRLNANNKSA